MFLCSGTKNYFYEVTDAIFDLQVKMQSNRAHQTEAPTTASVFRRVAREDGYLGRGGLLTKGVTATMGRNGAFNMVYFGLYHTVMVTLLFP